MASQKYEGSVGARATVMIELSGLGSWGTPYTMEQVIDQARERAGALVRRAFEREGERVAIRSIEVTAVYAPGKPVSA